MPDAFFQKKRKRSAAERPARRARDAASEDEGGDDALGPGAVDDMDLLHDFDEHAPAQEETPAEAKVRLAKLYLEGLREKDDEVDGIDAADVDRDNIAARLRKDVEETSGRLHIRVAARLRPPAPEHILAVRGHRAPLTCVRASEGGASFVTADKDGHVWQWRLADGAQIARLPRTAAAAPTSSTSGAARRRARARRHERAGGAYAGTADRPPDAGSGPIWTLALSDDGRFCATGGRDRTIGLWELSDAAPAQWLRALTGHKDSVRALAFRGGSHELLSASYDRTVKLFDAAQQSYIETLFGHQEAIQDLSCLRAERAVTAGGRERTLRLWKIREESQLVFRGGARSKVHALLEGGDLVDTPGVPQTHEGSLDCVAMIDDHHFVSGSDSGTLALWSIAKKKPLFAVHRAHGEDVRASDSEGEQRTPRYITSIAALPYGDVFASGSWDGHIRLWALDASLASFRFLAEVPAHGVVNSLQLLTPAIEHMDDFPVAPTRWRRRGGLDAPLEPPAQQAPSAPRAARRRAGLRTTADGHVLGVKESIAPILLAAIAPEPRADRWVSVPDAANGALIVPLYLDDSS